MSAAAAKFNTKGFTSRTRYVSSAVVAKAMGYPNIQKPIQMWHAQKMPGIQLGKKTYRFDLVDLARLWPDNFPKFEGSFEHKDVLTLQEACEYLMISMPTLKSLMELSDIQTDYAPVSHNSNRMVAAINRQSIDNYIVYQKKLQCGYTTLKPEPEPEPEEPEEPGRKSNDTVYVDYQHNVKSEQVMPITIQRVGNEFVAKEFAIPSNDGGFYVYKLTKKLLTEAELKKYGEDSIAD